MLSEERAFHVAARGVCCWTLFSVVYSRLLVLTIRIWLVLYIFFWLPLLKVGDHWNTARVVAEADGSINSCQFVLVGKVCVWLLSGDRVHVGHFWWLFVRDICNRGFCKLRELLSSINLCRRGEEVAITRNVAFEQSWCCRVGKKGFWPPLVNSWDFEGKVGGVHQITYILALLGFKLKKI